jgi:predicted nucleic acid-binding protein
MLAIDTNVVVRYLTADHPEQSKRARAAVDENHVWVPTTVVLESEWVLRSAYGFTRGEVTAALRRFAGLPRVTLQSPEQVAQALDWADGGVDFADALHMAAAGGQDAFVTFDERLVRARPAGAIDVRRL